MKSKLTITAKIFNPSVHSTKDNAKLYSFSMGLSQQNKQTEKWENIYLPVTIYDKENQHEWILQADKKEITIEGQLTIKSGYTKRDGTVVAPHIGVFGFEAYIGKKQGRSSHENERGASDILQPTQSLPQSVSNQQRPTQNPTAHKIGDYQADFPEQSDYVPF